MNSLSDAIYDKLYANASILTAVGTRIFRGVAPQMATYPLIVFMQIAGGTISETPVDAADPLYLVSAVSEISPAEAETLAGYIETALHRSELTVSGWTNIWTAVETHLETVQLPGDGRPLWQAGRFVRFRLSK